MKYYSLIQILKVNAHYNVIIGERSNGKSFAALKYALESYFKTGKQFAIVRRYREDISGARGAAMFSSLNSAGIVSKHSEVFDCVVYYSRRFYLGTYDKDLGKAVRSDIQIGYVFALSEVEHDKSTSFPDVTTVIFDEFISRTAYIVDEFVAFTNVLSTIIRQRNDVKIFMLGNTVNKYCPYFKEMGLTRIESQKQGTIDVYQYGEKGKLKIAVEYCSPLNASKQSDVYFAFDNPKLKMITQGAWELNVYPHLPTKYAPKDVLFTYFIEFDGHTLQAEIVQTEKDLFTYIHAKTTPIKSEDDVVFTPISDGRPNHFHSLNTATSPFHARLLAHFKAGKVFYQDNEIGEIVRAFQRSA